MKKQLLNEINNSFKFLYSKPNATRSPDKIRGIHSLISDLIIKKINNVDFQVHHLQNSERKIKGKYYNKNVDIAITYKDVDIGGISIKFITGNYKQNSNNYFEILMGETANLRRENYIYASFNIIPKYIPYYNNKSILKSIEYITEKDVEKYIKLIEDNEDICYHKPNLTCLFFIDNNTEFVLKNNIKKVLLQRDLLDVLKTKQHLLNINENIQNPDAFLDAFVYLIKAKSYFIKTNNS